jgi:hypothetical protein
VSKRIDDITLERFIQDVKSLRSLYTDAKIAAIMKTNPGNFSSRVTGGKRPGQDFIDRFYQVWSKELKDLEQGVNYDMRKQNPSGSAQSKDAIYQDERLQRLEAGISRLDTAIGSLMERLVVSHEKLIDSHLSILSQQTKRAEKRTK